MLYQETNSIGVHRFECIKYIDFRYVPHLHKHPELVYVENGELDICVDNIREHMRAGDFAFVFGNSIHSYLSDCSTAYVCVFSDDLISEFYRELNGKAAVRSVFRCDTPTEKYVVKMLFENSKRDNMIIMLCLYAICGCFLNSVPLTDAVLKKNDNILIYKILIYISENYADNITLSGMANALGYDSRYLSKYINTNLKTGFCSLVNSSRVDKARELLSDTDLPVNKIAQLSGFRSVRNFNRIFKEYVGVSPRNL